MNGRLKVLIGIVFFLGLCIIGRLFELQVLGHNFLGSTIYNKKIREQIIPANRGRIFIHEDKDVYPIAINLNTYNLIVSPNAIVESKIKPGEWLSQIAPYINISELTQIQDQPIIIKEGQETNELKDILIQISQKDDFYELLKTEISSEKAEKIKELGLPGIRLDSISQRYYPEEELFSHLLGFVSPSIDCHSGQCAGGTGQYGIEEFFNKELAGQPGLKTGEFLSRGLSRADDNVIKSAKDGLDLVLTIDRSIQYFACQLLEDALQEYQSASGSILVLDTKTSAIIALCNQPNFNPNKYSEVEPKNYEVFKNPVISSAFEPGSIFKVITMAIALDARKITPETTYMDPGVIRLNTETIRNVEGRTFGQQTMTQVLEKSINTGAVYAAQKVGRAGFRNYLKKFGFGSLTRIELAGEAVGNISNLEKKQDIYLATASYGQGITATTIQMVNAVGAIANKGKLMKPHLIYSTIKDGQTDVRKPETIRQVISPSAAASLTAMMVSVCENGYGRRAKVDGYYVAGKTGTAQVAKSTGGYSDEVIHTFIGFAPATNPKFVALVKLDNPQQGNFADSTAVPTFGKLADFILNYYNLLPDKK